MYIESPQNEKVRAWSQLKTKKGRQKQGLFLVEGRRLVDELLQSEYDIRFVLWDVGADEPSDDFRNHPKVARRFVELSPAAFAEVSDTTTPQGIIAVAEIPSSELAVPRGRALLLDGIQDPGNVGTLLRTAEAFGFTSVCSGTSTVDVYSPKVVRASMGGLFRLGVQSLDSAAFIETWRSAHPDGQVIVTAADAPHTCYEAALHGDVLVVIGSEAFGASEEVRAQADTVISIPMQAQTESLNAAIAGSIVLYEAFRQRQSR